MSNKHAYVSFKAIVALWDQVVDFSDDLGVERGTGKAMAQRDAIPSCYWERLVAIARARGFVGVTHECLAHISAARGPKCMRREDAPSQASSRAA